MITNNYFDSHTVHSLKHGTVTQIHNSEPDVMEIKKRVTFSHPEGKCIKFQNDTKFTIELVFITLF